MSDPTVTTRAYLIDPATQTVRWRNRAAQDELTGRGRAPGVDDPIEKALPVAATLGVPAALRAVAETGEAAHLGADLITTSRGGVSLVASIERLPDGALLLLVQHGVSLTRRRAAR